MATLAAEISLSILSRLSNASDLSSVVDAINRSYNHSFSHGSGINQASNIFADRRTLGSGANEDLDMAGPLTNAFGAALVFTEVKVLIFHALSTNTVNLTVTRPAANGLAFLAAAGDGFVLKPNGLWMYVDPSDAGIAVVAGTGDLINVANGAGSSQYDVIIIGVAA